MMYKPFGYDEIPEHLRGYRIIPSHLKDLPLGKRWEACWNDMTYIDYNGPFK